MHARSCRQSALIGYPQISRRAARYRENHFSTAEGFFGRMRVDANPHMQSAAPREFAFLAGRSVSLYPGEADYS